MPPNGNSWDEYKKFVVETLKQHNTHFGEIFKRLRSIEVEVAKLKIRAGIWGLLGGAIPAVIILAIILIRAMWG